MQIYRSFGLRPVRLASCRCVCVVRIGVCFEPLRLRPAVCVLLAVLGSGHMATLLLSPARAGGSVRIEGVTHELGGPDRLDCHMAALLLSPARAGGGVRIEGVMHEGAKSSIHCAKSWVQAFKPLLRTLPSEYVSTPVQNILTIQIPERGNL